MQIARAARGIAQRSSHAPPHRHPEPEIGRPAGAPSVVISALLLLFFCGCSAGTVPTFSGTDKHSGNTVAAGSFCDGGDGVGDRRTVSRPTTTPAARPLPRAPTGPEHRLRSAATHLYAEGPSHSGKQLRQRGT